MQSRSKSKEGARHGGKKGKSKQTFTDFYSKQFSIRWPALLAALRQPSHHCCLVNKFSDQKEMEESLKEISSSLHQIEWITLPCYVNQAADGSEAFPSPSKDLKGVTNYYLLDAASVVVAEMLDVQPGDKVMDLCAAPGGKSVALAQCLMDSGGVGTLYCNEVLRDRANRLKAVIKDYIPQEVQGRVVVSSNDATQWNLFGVDRFDRVLVDAPCSSERHLIHGSQDLTKWTPARTAEAADRQQKLLSSAIRIVKNGGTVVYSTCSISDVENDGVVDTVLERMPFKVTVIKKEFPIGEKTKNGWIILPDVAQGWGPIFFAILRKDGKKEDSEEEDSDEESEESDAEDS